MTGALFSEPLTSISDLPEPTALARFIELRFPKYATMLDATYGRGRFWTGNLRPTVTNDILRPAHLRSDFRYLPFRDSAFDLVVFDPPFQPLTTIGMTGEKYTVAGNNIEELRQIVTDGLLECWRVSRIGIVVKVQDYIHNHKPVWMSLWLVDALGEPDDCFHLRQQTPKIRATNWGRQLSVWRNHATFYSFRRGKSR